MRNKKLFVQLVAGASVLIVGYLSVKAIEIKQVVKQLDKQIEQAQGKLEKEQEVLMQLEEERRQMDSLEYIEKVAREKLGMVKADDIVFKKK